MTTILVSTIGGHLAQLHALAPRLPDVDLEDTIWVTHDSAQSRSLLAGQQVEFVPYIDERDFVGVAKAFGPALATIRRTQADSVISTGSAIAGAWLPAAASLRRRAVFIESAAMVEAHTRTGRLLARIPRVQMYTQSARTAGPGWAYCGSVFDGFTSQRDTPDVGPQRIVVTVGTSREFGFRNLLERLIQTIPEGPSVLWQTGCTDVSGLPIEATPWLSALELSEAMRSADLVVSHAGGGSALATLLSGKRPLLVPRRAERNEFRDNHQEQIATLLEAENLASKVDLDSLDWSSLVDATGWSVTPTPQHTPIALEGAR